MKQRIASLTLLAAITLALAAAALVSQRASAQCGTPGSPPCEPDKKKRPTPTVAATSVIQLLPVTAVTLTPSATAESQPAGAAVPVCTPDTSNLAQLCSTFVGAGGPSSGAKDPGPNGSPTAPYAPPYTGFEVGGALVLGILIGLLVPAVRTAINGLGAVGGSGNLSGNTITDGTASMFGKDRKLGDDTVSMFDKDRKLGYGGQPGPVQDTSNQFAKGVDSSITDGTSGTPDI